MGKGGVYSINEKLLLAKLVKQFKVIENRATNATTNQAKKEAWRRVAHLYNSQALISQRRAPNQLRKLWDNLKQKKRKAVQGYGPPAQANADPVLSMVALVKPRVPWDAPNDLGRAELDVPHVVKVEPLGTDSYGNVLNAAERDVEPETLPTSEMITVQPANSGIDGGTQLELPEAWGVEERLRVRKLEEAIEQQRELHRVRLQVAKVELEHAKVRLELEKQKLTRVVFDDY